MSASHISLGLCPSIPVIACGILVASSRVNSGLFPPSAALSGFATENARPHSYHSELVAFVYCAFRVYLVQGIDESAQFTHPFSALPKIGSREQCTRVQPRVAKKDVAYLNRSKFLISASPRNLIGVQSVCLEHAGSLSRKAGHLQNMGKEGSVASEGFICKTHPGGAAVRRGQGGSFRCEAETFVATRRTPSDVRFLYMVSFHPPCLYACKVGTGKFHGVCGA